MDTTVNLNAAECIKQTNGIGTTTYHNICRGTSEVINWGAGDWISNIAIGFLFGFMILLILGSIIMFAQMMRGY